MPSSEDNTTHCKVQANRNLEPTAAKMTSEETH